MMHDIPQRGGIRERILREEWNLGVIRQSVDDIARHGIVQPIAWLPRQSPWFGLADPGCYAHNGQLVVLAERLNWLTGRGEIWSATAQPGSDLTKVEFRPWARAATHLSYPLPFRVDGDLYLTMEAAETGALWIWRRSRFGDWRSLKLMDRPAIDPTFWYDQTGWWLFCTFADEAPDQNLHIFFADCLEGTWSPHPMSPVDTALYNIPAARSAGSLFYSDGRLIRPSQNSTRTYGGAIVLNIVQQLDRQVYREAPLRMLVPDRVYPHGLHTLCAAGDVTIVDGKRWGFNLLDPIRYPIVGLQNRYRRRSNATNVCFLTC